MNAQKASSRRHNSFADSGKATFASRRRRRGVAQVREKAERHTAVLGRIKELEYERQERDRLRIDLNKIDTALARRVHTEQRQCQQALEKAQSARGQIGSLKEKAAEQTRLESTADSLKHRIGALHAITKQINSLDDRLGRLRESYKSTITQLKEAESCASQAAELDLLEKRNSELVHSLARLKAGLESDEPFRSEIKNGLCPVLSEKCLNLKDGFPNVGRFSQRPVHPIAVTDRYA